MTLPGPFVASSATERVTESGFRPQIATEAPSRSSIFAIARPIPRVAPVTRATLFSKVCEVLFILFDDSESPPVRQES